MATTFQKRQKEIKRLEKQREKAERRARRKLAKARPNEFATESAILANDEALDAISVVPFPPESQT